MSSRNFLYDMLDAFGAVIDEDEKWNVANGLARELGGNSLTMGCVGVGDGVPHWMRSTMSSSWLAEYVDQKHYEFDRLTEHTRVSQSTLTVNVAEGTSKDDLGWFNLNQGLLDAGYKTLYLEPFATGAADTRSAVTFNSEFASQDFLTAEFRRKFRILSTFMTADIGAPGANIGEITGAVDLEKNNISDREKQTIEYLSLGMRNIEIAYTMGIAEVSVRKNIISVRRKLGAKTREQAIAIAIKNGIITL